MKSWTHVETREGGGRQRQCFLEFWGLTDPGQIPGWDLNYSSE